jgi:hypothetical protein
MPDSVASEHLLHEEQRVGPHAQGVVIVCERPFERGQQTPVLGDVVRGNANRLGEFLDERPVGGLDADAVRRRSGIAASAAVDIRHDGGLIHRREWQLSRSVYDVGWMTLSEAVVGAFGAKYRMR